MTTSLHDSATPAPAGCRPRWMLDEERKAEIEGAIARYTRAHVEIPAEWHDELREIDARLAARG